MVIIERTEFFGPLLNLVMLLLWLLVLAPAVLVQGTSGYYFNGDPRAHENYIFFNCTQPFLNYTVTYSYGTDDCWWYIHGYYFTMSNDKNISYYVLMLDDDDECL